MKAVEYHLSMPKRVLRPLRKWLRSQEQLPPDIDSQEQWFDVCLEWMNDLGSVDFIIGDPVLQQGPMQGLHRAAFATWYHKFLASTTRGAKKRAKLRGDRRFWECWLRARRAWEADADRRYGGDAEAQSRRTIEVNSTSESEELIALWSDDDDEPESEAEPGAGVSSGATWHGHATGSQDWWSQWHGSQDWSSHWRGGNETWSAGAAESSRQTTRQHEPEHEQQASSSACPPAPPRAAEAASVTFKPQDWDSNWIAVPVFVDAWTRPLVMTRDSEEWQLAASMRFSHPALVPGETGRFAWNDLQAKVLKHAYRTEGATAVEHIKGKNFRHWTSFCRRFAFNLGTPSDSMQTAVTGFLCWMTHRPRIDAQVESLRVVHTKLPIHYRQGSEQEPLDVGLFLYVRLRGEPDFDQCLGPKTEEGFHSTSMYCLHRLLVHRGLREGPGQLEVGGARTSAVYYHRSKFAHLCLGSYSHYLALYGGPWFYAPVLRLECSLEHPALYREGWTRKPTSIRGQGLTYPGAHRIVGCFIHIIHAADMRFHITPDFHQICEGRWSPNLEIPVDLPWEELVQRSFDQRKNDDYGWTAARDA
jgi:hypothetical protein